MVDLLFWSGAAVFWGNGDFCRGRVIFHFGFYVEKIFLFVQGEGYFGVRVI